MSNQCRLSCIVWHLLSSIRLLWRTCRQATTDTYIWFRENCGDQRPINLQSYVLNIVHRSRKLSFFKSCFGSTIFCSTINKRIIRQYKVYEHLWCKIKKFHWHLQYWILPTQRHFCSINLTLQKNWLWNCWSYIWYF